MRRFLFAAVALVFSASLFAQDYEADLQGNIDRTGGVYHGYEGVPGVQTPAPKGYKPFYVSHYGRHGSRRQIGRSGTEAYKMLNEANEAGLLTDEGKALYKDVEVIYNCHVGMDGQLTIRGGKEHQGVSQRMYERFKPVFKGSRAVHVQSSIIQRCLISMANFTTVLKGNAPKLEFDFITGEKYMDVICHDYYDEKGYSPRKSAITDSLAHELVDPSRMMKAFFKESPNLPDPWRFARSIFYIVADCQDLYYEAGGLDLYKYFTKDELIAMAKYGNERTYASFGNSLEFGDNVRWAEKWLVEDFVNRADDAISAGDVAADLRFGHDSAVLPLACLLGLEGVADRYHVGDAWKNGWYSWENVSMCTNIQFGFYRNKKGDVLVKILYNEKEKLIPALTPVTGPYYNWADLRAYLVGLSADKTFGK